MTAHARPSTTNLPAALAVGAALVGTVVLANWLVTRYGTIPVGFGQRAPAAVLAAGLAFTLRDVLHELAGVAAVLVAIVAGAVLSLLVGADGTIPGGLVAVAVASGLAFLLSELTDLLVYAPMRRRGWLRAVALSGAVGLVVDSVLFLWLAFGSLAFLPGQIIGKAGVLGLTVLAVAPLRARLAPSPA